MEPISINQPADNTAKNVSQKAPRRIKARHLSGIVRKAILDKFAAVEDIQETADQLGLGLTKDTVTSVLVSFAIRKQPAPAQAQTINGQAFLVRKTGVA